MTGWEEEGSPKHRKWRHSDTGSKIEMITDINAGGNPYYNVKVDGGGVNGFLTTSDLGEAWKKVNESKTNFSYRKKKSAKPKPKRKVCRCKK